MDSITANRQDVLKALRENREAHRKIFEEALVGYRREAEKVLADHLERVQSGHITRVQIVLPMPVDHTKDYDRVIRMVEMHQEPNIELTEHDVQQYVMDDWSWKREFLMTNSGYSQTAAAALAV